jgi:CRISPR-associated protein Cas2
MVNNYFVIYDISEDDLRFNVAAVCKEYGLERIQKSVFFGPLTKMQYRELKIKVDEIIEDGNGTVLFNLLCDSCVKKKDEITYGDAEGSILGQNDEIIDEKTKLPVVIIL